MPERCSLFSTEMVPTRTGWPLALYSLISLAALRNFSIFRAIDHVRVFLADHGAVGGDHDHFELVDLVELGRFGFRGTGHAGELLVHAEIVLEGDGGEGLVLALDFDAFLGFDGLVQAIAPAAAGHEAAGELVDDDDFGAFVAIADHVFTIALVEHVGAQGLLHVMVPLDVLRVVEVADVEQFFELEHTLFGERGALVLFVDGVVAGGVLFAGLLAIDDFAADEFGDDAVDLVVLVGGFLAGSGDDQRGAGFVDEDGIDFVDDGKVVHALDAIVDAELHVVAQVIEAEFVVGAVGDVGVVGVLAFLVVQIVDDDADAKAEEFVEAAHPFGVAAGEVVVDGDDVDALAAEGVEVAGQGGDERLTFTGLHFGDLAFVKDHAADQLDVEMAHVEDAASGLADHGEGFYEEVVERGALSDSLFKFNGFSGQVDVGELAKLGLQGGDRGHGGQHRFDFALVFSSEDFGQNGINHE